MNKKKKKILASFEFPRAGMNKLLDSDSGQGENKSPRRKKLIFNSIKERFTKLQKGSIFSGAVETLREEILMLLKGPRARAKRFLIVGFNQAMVEIVHVEFLSGGLQVLVYDSRKILSGNEKREEAIEMFIANFLHENSIVDKEIIVSISGEDSVVVHALTLPVLPKAEILEVAKWKLKEEVCFDLKAALFGWQFTREHTDEEGVKGHEFVFVAAEETAVKKYLSIMYKCRLNPIGVAVGSFNYIHILKHLPESPKVSAVLDIGHNMATLNIYSKGKLYFVRRLPASWSMFTQALAKTLVSDKGTTRLSVEEAEIIKRTIGIPQDENQKIKDDIRGANIMFLLRPLLESLVRELKLSFNYFSTNLEMDKPSRLFVVGGGSDLKNLEKYLQEKIEDIEVSCLPLPDCLYLKAAGKNGAPQSKLQNMINTIGAALDDTQEINLLPEEMKARRGKLLRRIYLRLTALMVGVIFLILTLLSKFQADDYRGRLKAASAHLNVISGVKVLKENLQLKEDLIVRIQKGKIPGHGLLIVLGNLIPNAVVLDELSFNQKNHRLVLNGKVLASEETMGTTLSGFMRELEASSFFKEASLVSSGRVEGAQEFEINCDLAY